MARPVHPYLDNGRFLAMGHRGGRGLWPENTMYGFERAAALGVDVLELDIHSTSDGVLVVMHNDTVDETTSGHGPIHSYSHAALKELDAGYRWTADGGRTFPYRGQGITVPTLAEVLLAFPGLRVNIDLKQETPSIVEPFCQMLHEYERLRSVMVGSFFDRTLANFRARCPGVATAAGPGEVRHFYMLQRARLALFYRPESDAFSIPETNDGRRIITPYFIEQAHKHGVAVHVWTVNEEADMRRLIEWGVDGLISDYPDRLVKLAPRAG